MNSNVTMGDLRDAYQTAAEVVELYGDAFLPVFQRLHNEIEARSQKQDIRAIALSVAGGKPASIRV